MRITKKLKVPKEHYLDGLFVIPIRGMALFVLDLGVVRVAYFDVLTILFFFRLRKSSEKKYYFINERNRLVY